MTDRGSDIVAQRVERAVRAIRRRSSLVPEVGVILGSGQGGFSRRLDNAAYLPFADVPHFFRPTVPGHEGLMTMGTLEGRPVVVLEGRIHIYEGHFMRDVVFPVRVLRALGAGTLVVSNAAGAVRPDWEAGEVMIIADHLNLMGASPLVGHLCQTAGHFFLSMQEAYDPVLRLLGREAGMALGEELREGVLAAVTGPCYETPAESRMLASAGADAVTMSTIPEVIMARHLGMRVLGLSLVTNVHRPGVAVNHDDVLAVARRRVGFLMDLVAMVIARLPLSPA